MTRRSPAARARLERALSYVVAGIAAAFLVSLAAALFGGDDAGSAGSLANPALGDARVRVEVLNGAGTPGLARDATDRLRGLGFDVVFYGNADDFEHATSVVLDRGGSPERARAVARALGIDSVRAEPDPSLVLDATVVLGKDR